MSREIDPVLSYRFYIAYAGRTGAGSLRAKSVSGLGFTMNLTEFNTTGGPKALPSDLTFNNLIIERAILERPENLGERFEELMNTLTVEQLEMSIFLMDAQGRYTRAWIIKGAYTVRWQTSDFDAKSNDVLIETLEFKYDLLRQVPGWT